MVRGDEEQVIGSIRDEITPLRGADPVLRRVLTLVRGNASLIDSTFSNLETLAPIWHRSVQPQRTLVFEMEGARVVGSISTPGAPTKQIDTTIAEPAFDSSNWDLIVRALPLENGEATVISVFDLDNKLHRYTARVLDRQVRGKTDVIHVLMELGRGRESHAWFDDKTRVLLRVETQIGPDLVLRQVLKGQ